MKKLSIPILLLITVLFSCSPKDQEPGEIKIIPTPQKAEVLSGYFTIDENTQIVLSEIPGNRQTAEYLVNILHSSTGYEFQITEEDIQKNKIRYMKANARSIGEEGYELVVEENGVTIRARSLAGFFYGTQTFLQLLPPAVFAGTIQQQLWKVPFVDILDNPRFPWRGMHLDVSRHFFPVEFIKKYIDLIAFHKMNIFHWHLTDDNGWRIEIKAYPKLTEVAAWRVDREDYPWREAPPPEPGEKATYGGYYTQEEIREVVSYAADRQITIIPEVEMPGHTSEVFAAYPELSCRGNTLYVQPASYWPNEDIFCAGKEATFEFLEAVLEEVITLFPADYVHIGGDEATKTRWETCKLCQARIRNEGLKDEDELQSWFIKRIEKFLNSKDKKLIGWDEILEGGLAPEAIVMSWRGMKGGIEAALKGHHVIMCPTSHCYFDYYQANPDFEPEAIGGFTTLKKVYSFEPVPEELFASGSEYILGAQGNVWTEYIKSGDHAEYMAVPRMSALAEVVWSAKENREWHDFQERLQQQFKRFDHLGINYSDGSWKVDIQPDWDNGSYKIELTSEQYKQPIHYNLDGSELSTSSAVYTKPLTISESVIIKAGLYKDGKLMEYPSEKEIVFHLGLGKGSWLQELPSERYMASGARSLGDGLLGSENFRDGYWLGFEGRDLDYEIDLGKSILVKEIKINFLQNTGSWIFMPEEVIISVYTTDKTLVAEYETEPQTTIEAIGTVIETINPGINQPEAHYIRVLARNMKTIPDWHEGGGNKAWLFVDEVIIR